MRIVFVAILPHDGNIIVRALNDDRHQLKECRFIIVFIVSDHHGCFSAFRSNATKFLQSLWTGI